MTQTMKNRFRPVRRAARALCPKTWCVGGRDLRTEGAAGNCPDCAGSGFLEGN